MLADILPNILQAIVTFTHDFGYGGIFIMTSLESTFVPIPSEVTMVPAGYLVQQGHMNLFLVLLASLLGTLFGSAVNYWLALKLGRNFLLRYGRWLRVTEAKIIKVENFFERHGAAAIFLGRLVVGVRHYISFPAGLARMDLRRFFIFTALGGMIWVSILVGLGYVIGANQTLLAQSILWLKFGLLAVITLAVIVYVWRHRRARAK